MTVPPIRANLPGQLEKLFTKYPDLVPMEKEITDAFEMWRTSYHQGGKTLLCGNGGSASDSEHIVGELMKGFVRQRPVPPDFAERLRSEGGDAGHHIASHLQGALPAISLVSQTSLMTAYMNDVAADLVFAQQVYGYGRVGDVLVALSTSGRSANILHAVTTARALGMKTLGLTGGTGGDLAKQCDVCLTVPFTETLDIQERHIALYHTLCLLLEEEFFDR